MSQKLLTLDESRLVAVTANLEPSYKRRLESMPASNASTICDFILDEITANNIKDSTKGLKLFILSQMSASLNHKPFRELTREDLLAFLTTAKKNDQVDPEQKWIGTYNSRVRIITTFLRWLHYSKEHTPRNRKTPKILSGIRQLPRKEKSRYKPQDMWTVQEQAIFLKYCQSKRDRAFVAMMLDTSARPHELLKLNIGDLQFKIEHANGCQYCEITVSGKTGARTLPVIDSVPYLKDWIASHPQGNNAQSPLFICESDRNYGARLHRDSA